MKKDNALRDLELQYRQLLFSMRLPDAVLDPAAPPFVKELDLAFARDLLGGQQPWGGEDVFSLSEELVRDVITASPEGKKLYLASEIDLLRKVKATGGDEVHHGPFGVTEAVFPIRLRGHVVHLVRSGKYVGKPFAAEDLKEMSFLAGVNIKKVEDAARSLSVYDGEQADRLHAQCRSLRDALAAALDQHLRIAELTRQQLDSERMQSLGTMAQGMAHHINNLLTTILGYASMVSDKAKLENDLGDALKRVIEAAQRGRRFTEEVLAVAGAEDEEETPTPVHDRIQGVLTLLQNRLSGKIEVSTNLLAKRDVVVGPAGAVHQVIFNLLADAIDGLPAGGSISISTANGRDETDGRDLIHLEVTETGGAKDAAGDRKKSPRLTSVMGLVGRLEGTVNVTSTLAGASRILVTLPAIERAVRIEKKMRRRLAPSRIWVADDDSVVREMCRRVLTEEGHTVEEADSGKNARDKLAGEKQAKPDLIVYDFNMPDYSGLEFCTQLREEGNRVPVLLLSGFKPDQGEISDALKLRKTFFLQKPFSFRDMSDMVTVALGETLIEE